jgi:hypothetical protein
VPLIIKKPLSDSEAVKATIVDYKEDSAADALRGVVNLRSAS